VTKLLRFRREHAHSFVFDDYPAAEPFAWKSETLGEANWASKHIAQFYSDASQGPQLMVLINMESGNVTFQLPPGIAWRRLLDTQAYFEGDGPSSGNITLDAPALIPGNSYGVVGHSIVVLQAAAE
jgi:glycogen operon protein